MGESKGKGGDSTLQSDLRFYLIVAEKIAMTDPAGTLK